MVNSIKIKKKRKENSLQISIFRFNNAWKVTEKLTGGKNKTQFTFKLPTEMLQSGFTGL